MSGMTDTEKEALEKPWEALQFLVWLLVEADSDQIRRIDIEAEVPMAAEDVRVALREWQKQKKAAEEGAADDRT